MKTNILFIFTLILTASTIKGQDQESLLINKIHSVNLHIGQNQIKEMNLFPMTHKRLVTTSGSIPLMKAMRLLGMEGSLFSLFLQKSW